ncbi:MAG: hypothetical protein ACYDHD_08890 [Vulcanimicrobiaceae bacterium]
MRERWSPTNSTAKVWPSAERSTATIVGYATLGLGGLFFHNWVKGRNVVIDPSKTFTTFVDRTVHVMATQLAPNDQYAH